MLISKANDRNWQPGREPGVERSVLRTNAEGGRTLLVRLKAGARGLRHTHGGIEEIVVLEGTVDIGGARLAAGDYMMVGEGEEHDVAGVTDAVIFVASQRASRVVESGAG